MFEDNMILLLAVILFVIITACWLAFQALASFLPFTLVMALLTAILTILAIIAVLVMSFLAVTDAFKIFTKLSLKGLRDLRKARDELSNEIRPQKIKASFEVLDETTIEDEGDTQDGPAWQRPDGNPHDAFSGR